MTFSINGKPIGPGNPMFIIAEIGVNHNGSVEKAKQLIDHAKEAGANAVKFQAYHTESLVTDQSELVQYQKSGGGYSSQKEMLLHYQLSKSQFEELKKHCEQQEILFLATPFDLQSADMLEDLGVEAYKIGSGDITFYPLLKKLSTFHKPVILSSGMTTIEEIEKAIQLMGQTPIALLHCTSAYPTPPEDVHLNVIHLLKKYVSCPIGLSDHTSSTEVALAANALGYTILEKHFTLDRHLPGPDHKASITPEELKTLIKQIRIVEKAMGEEKKAIQPSEVGTKPLVRRGIYLNIDKKAGSVVEEGDLIYLRPEHTLSAADFERVIGKRIARDMKKGEPLQWGDFEVTLDGDGS
ncbi:N-acetylneuraminate synthase family protein [Alteribacter aurantiacus]|uniref:N-acetylneuraminate synthase family protein n=1 Tax=Alteribacter aurantiacus TaxID=254410 RepID=UPI0003FC1833|nr:N-acetylneuraminate synthase family protein [Alteribacter aurantiacus]